MIYFTVGDITKSKTEAIINAANGCGIMGAGISGALKRVCGKIVEEEAKEAVKRNQKPFESGSCYYTGAGSLTGVSKIYHAVTMTYPGRQTTKDAVKNCFDKALIMAVVDGIKDISVPGLGIGIGRLNKNVCAEIMVEIAEKYKNLIDIYFVDLNDDFIDFCKKEAELNYE